MADTNRSAPNAQPHVNKLSDEELIARARDSPEDRSELLDELYRRYYAKVAQWCLRMTKSESEARDLAQDVFLRVHRGLASFRFESRFSTWLYTVTRRTAINRAASAARHPTENVEDVEIEDRPDPKLRAFDRLQKAERGAALRDAIRDRLEPREAQVLYLHFVDGLSLPAISRLFRMSNKSGAKADLVRAKRKLRAHFREMALTLI